MGRAKWIRHCNRTWKRRRTYQRDRKEQEQIKTRGMESDHTRWFEACSELSSRMHGMPLDYYFIAPRTEHYASQLHLPTLAQIIPHLLHSSPKISQPKLCGVGLYSSDFTAGCARKFSTSFRRDQSALSGCHLRSIHGET